MKNSEPDWIAIEQSIFIQDFINKEMLAKLFEMAKRTEKPFGDDVPEDTLDNDLNKTFHD